MPAQTLADAALDRRVARANARDAYRKTVQRARAQLTRDYARADARWVIAANRARDEALVRRGIRARYREMGPIPLREELSRFEYMLTPAYAVYTEPGERARAQVLARMIRVELARRGEDVS